MSNKATRQAKLHRTVTVFVDATDIEDIKWTTYYSPDMHVADAARLCGMASNFGIKPLDGNEIHTIERYGDDFETTYPDKILVDGKYRKVFTSLDKDLTKRLLPHVALKLRPVELPREA